MKSSYKFEISAESKSYHYESGDLPVWISVDLSPLSPFVLVSLILNGRQPPPSISLPSNWSSHFRKVIPRFARGLGWVSTASWAKQRCAGILWEKIRLREMGRSLNSHPTPTPPTLTVHKFLDFTHSMGGGEWYDVKLGHAHWGRNVGWGYSRIGCWVGYLGLSVSRYQWSGENYRTRS
jgi:hypothetical protein